MRQLLVTGLVSALLLAYVSLAQSDKTISTSGGKIKMKGKSGWINFCPATADDSVTDGADDSCVTIRLFKFQEVDDSGDAVAADGNKGKKKRINNLYSVTTFGNTETGMTEPNCTKAAPYPCAWRTLDNGTEVGLSYSSLRLTIDLSTFNSGSIVVGVLVFQDNGTLSWDNKEVGVQSGTFKFNVQISNYAFVANNNTVQFEVRSKNKGRDLEEGFRNKHGGQTAGGLFNFPRFVSWAGSDRSAANATWSDASVTTRRDDSTLVYAFNGNFQHAYYDPIVADSTTTESDSDDADSDGAVGVSVAVLSFVVAILSALAM